MLLRLNDDALQLFENWELLVGRINLSIALLLAREKSNFFKLLEFTLDIAWVFFDQLRESAHMRPKIWVLGVHHYNFSPHS